ncbi:uncharacterized protein LOC114316776 [Camellia sinensis]|uniref:uncharacterized protein LOC114316776 n=1 Tax=Camellia sinensis TaxID=4442 RepID=UPI0010355C8E|nr:uncharacterized protein LOC114316776 [Camellia sinensis]
MRKKDTSLCLPFAFNGNHKNLVALRRLHDTKSKWRGDVEEEKKDEAEHATIIDRLGSQSSGLGTLICAEDGNKRIESMVCDASKIASTINEEKKEHDNLLFESDDFLAKNSHHDQRYVNNLSGLIRQKTRKVRSLNELLEDHSTRTKTGPSSVLPGIKGKRKIPYDKKDWKPLRFISPSSKLTKTTQVFKADVSVAVTDSKSQQDAYARVDSRASLKNQWNQHIINRNAMLRKMKNKQTQLEIGFPPLTTRQDVVPKTNQVEIGDGRKNYVAAVDGGFSKSIPNVFSKRVFLFDLNEKMDVDNEMENLVPQVENWSSSPHHPQLVCAFSSLKCYYFQIFSKLNVWCNLCLFTLLFFCWLD